MRNDDFDALAESIHKRAIDILEKREWKPGPDPWTGKADSKPEPARFEPSGHKDFDKVVQRLKPAFKYGGNQPMNAVRGDIFQLRMFAYFNDQKRLKPPKGSMFIVLPHKSDFATDDAYVSTVAHEMMHWWETMDPEAPISHGLKDSSRGVDPENGVDPHYIVEELTAELGSALLLRATNVDPNIENRAMYFAGYFAAVPPKFRDHVFAQAKTRAIKAVNGMLAA
jgi:hypothetical protein